MSRIWAQVLAIVMPIIGDVLRILALQAWEMVEKWAQSLGKQGVKPTSEEKREMYAKAIKLFEPGLSDERLALVRETAHAQKNKHRSGKTATV